MGRVRGWRMGQLEIKMGWRGFGLNGEKRRLKWFEHVKMRCIDAPVRRCKRLVIEGTGRSRCRLKKYWKR